MYGSLTALQELGDTTRLRVFMALLGVRKNVSQITAELGLAQPQVSYHLRRLREAGLAVEEKDGRWVWYQANWDSEDRFVRSFIGLMARWAEEVGARENTEADDILTGGARSVVLQHAGTPPRSGGELRSGERPSEGDESPPVERPKKRESDMEDFLL
jgi:DNA-binding transcriptional ArsR family regulator